MSTLELTSSASNDLLTFRYILASGVSLVLYQHLLTFDYEISYIWNTSISIWKVIFLTNRYLPLVTTTMFGLVLYLPPTSFKSCTILAYVVEFAVFVNIFVATCILTRRLYVIWSDNKKVTLVVCLLFAAITISSIIMFALAYSSNKDDLGGRIGSVVECIEVSPLNWVELFLFLLYESVCILLIGIKRYRTFSNSDGRYLPLLKILIDDGLAYYSYSISLALVDIAMFFFPKLRVLAVALVGLDSVLHSIISMHISIRLRHGAEATLVVDATSPFSHTNRTE